MSPVMRTTAARRAVFGLALAGLALSSIGNVSAGDLYAPGYYRYPQPGAIDRDRYHAAPPVYRGAEVNGGICRILHERRLDRYGREVIHRIRMCDDGPVYGSPRPAEPSVYEYEQRPNYRPSGYYPYPHRPAAPYPLRPPAPIGQDFYD